MHRNPSFDLPTDLRPAAARMPPFPYHDSDVSGRQSDGRDGEGEEDGQEYDGSLALMSQTQPAFQQGKARLRNAGGNAPVPGSASAAAAIGDYGTGLISGFPAGGFASSQDYGGG